MPRKTSSSNNSTKPQGPTKEQLEAIKNYLAQKPNFEKIAIEAKANPQTPAKKPESDYERTLREAVEASLEERLKEAETHKAQQVNMPVHPKEENTEANLYDKVAKESKDSTASTHELHKEGGKASVEHHKATPGPVMVDNLPEPASREELHKRAAELNKKT